MFTDRELSKKYNAWVATLDDTFCGEDITISFNVNTGTLLECWQNGCKYIPAGRVLDEIWACIPSLCDQHKEDAAQAEYEAAYNL